MTSSAGNNSLRAELQCPFCNIYMISAIHICQNGHNICNSCRESHEECPACKKPFTNIRNVSLENLAKQFKFSCKNAHLGCKECLTAKLLLDHQIRCKFDYYSCVMEKVSGETCNWEGNYEDLKEHVRVSHKEWLYFYNGKDTTRIQNFDANIGYSLVIFAENKIFLRKTEVRDKMWHCVVLHVGPEIHARNFRYRISIGKANDVESVTSCHRTRSVREKLYNIYFSANCFQMPYERLKRFFDKDKSLTYEMEIEKI